MHWLNYKDLFWLVLWRCRDGRTSAQIGLKSASSRLVGLKRSCTSTAHFPSPVIIASDLAQIKLVNEDKIKGQKCPSNNLLPVPESGRGGSSFSRDCSWTIASFFPLQTENPPPPHPFSHGWVCKQLSRTSNCPGFFSPLCQHNSSFSIKGNDLRG